MSDRHGPTSVDAPIEEFFAAFSAASDAGDWQRFGDMFLTHFLSADPAAASPVARDDLIAFLPHRKRIFDSVGVTGTALASLAIHHLDERYVLAETAWTVQYAPDRGPLEVPVLRSTFLLRLEDQWRIAVYLNHNDLLQLLGLA